MLIISCKDKAEASQKWSLIIPKAGAMAAPAITVRRDMERIVQVPIRKITKSSFCVWYSYFCNYPKNFTLKSAFLQKSSSETPPYIPGIGISGIIVSVSVKSSL